MFTVSLKGSDRNLLHIKMAHAKFLFQTETGNTNYLLVYHPSSAGELNAILQDSRLLPFAGPDKRPDNSNCTDGMEKVSD